MFNITPLIEGSLTTAQLRSLRAARHVSCAQSVECMLVGGAVRDIMLGTGTYDIDIVVRGDVGRYAVDLATELSGKIIHSSQLHTVKLHSGDVNIDIAMARKETYAHSGALPDLLPGTIEEDLARRDFTINSMGVFLTERNWGDLLDLHGGRRDLCEGVIRVHHDASFSDDPTRILRAIRYIGRLGMAMEPHTEYLLRRDIFCLGSVGGKRIWKELQHILRERHATGILREANDLGVLSAIYPGFGFEGDVLSAFSQLCTTPSVESDMVVLALLTSSIPPHERKGLIARLDLDSRAATVVGDMETVKKVSCQIASRRMKASSIYKALYGLSKPAITAWSLLSDDPHISENLNFFLTDLKQVKTELSGAHLVSLGIPEGPKIGDILRDLLVARLDGEIASLEDEKEFVLDCVAELE